MTFNDLSRPQMTSDPKNSNRFICSLVSAFQKHIGWKKSKKSLFRSIFKYELLFPSPSPSPSVCTSCTSLHLTSPHCTSCMRCTSLHLSSKVLILNPQSSILNPQFSGFLGLAWAFPPYSWKKKNQGYKRTSRGGENKEDTRWRRTVCTIWSLWWVFKNKMWIIHAR